MKVNLNEVIEAIDMASDGIQNFYDKRTGQIVTRFDSMIYGDYDDELEDDLEENWDQYISLPEAFDIDNYSIMEDFIDDLNNSTIQNQLARAIRGKGAFRRFKDIVIELGISDQWYHYLDEAHRKIAIKWCHDNDIEYIE